MDKANANLPATVDPGPTFSVPPIDLWLDKIGTPLQQGWKVGWNEMSGPTFNWPHDGYCCCPCIWVTYVHSIHEVLARAMGSPNLHRKLHIKYVVHPLCPPSRLQGVDSVDRRSGQAPTSVEGGL